MFSPPPMAAKAAKPPRKTVRNFVYKVVLRYKIIIIKI